MIGGMQELGETGTSGLSRFAQERSGPFASVEPRGGLTESNLRSRDARRILLAQWERVTYELHHRASM